MNDEDKGPLIETIRYSGRPRGSNGRKAVIYVTDAGFLYPTLVSALQVESAIDTSRIDLIIFLSNLGQEAFEIAHAAVADRHIRLETIDPSLYALPEGVEMSSSHVPPVSLARLLIDRVLDPIYERVLYLDGDTLVTGDIRPLLAFDPEPGMIGAVRGSIWLTRDAGSSASRQDENYVTGLGLRRPDNYFNAGVLSLRREDLAKFGAAAFDYLVRHPSRCRLYDQSALNQVFDGRVMELWPGYNYHTPYQELVSAGAAAPAIVHFTGALKPWVHRFGRFASFAAVYDEFDSRNADVARLRIEASASAQVEQRRRLRRRLVRERLPIWHWMRRRRRLQRYMRGFHAHERGVALTAGTDDASDSRAADRFP